MFMVSSKHSLPHVTLELNEMCCIKIFSAHDAFLEYPYYACRQNIGSQKKIIWDKKTKEPVNLY